MTLIPKEALENHIAILGKTGSGKSNAAKILAEGLMADGERVCVIDPTGTWWGMRLLPNGKPSPYQPVIFGGEHADLPLTDLHGAVIAEAIATSSDSVIIDTRALTVGQRVRFFTAFAETLLRLNRGPLHVIVDEAHIFMPQGKTDIEGGKMLHAGNNMVSLGRGVGLRIILISQRPQKLHKDSLTQTETLIAMRVMHPLDREAYEVWINEQGDKASGKEIVSSLASLPTGDAWVWSPLAGFLKRVHFPLARTFDSGKPLSRDQAAPQLAPLDTTALGGKMDAIRQEAQANDPKRLKARVAELERERSAERANPLQVVDQAALDRAFSDGRMMGYEQGVAQGHALAYSGARNEITPLVDRFDQLAERYREQTADFTKKIDARRDPAPKPNGATGPKTQAPPRAVATREAPSGEAIGPEKKPLAVLARVYPGGYSDAQWALLAGFKRTGGTWSTYKSRLRSSARIEERGSLWYATPKGCADAGENGSPMPAAGQELVAWWCDRIGAERKILQFLAEKYPWDIAHQGIADALDMTASGGTFNTYLSRLRSNGLIEETSDGSYRVAEALMK